MSETRLRRWRREIQRRWYILRINLRIKCPLCGAYEGHGPECRLRTNLDLEREAEQYRNAWRRDSQYWQSVSRRAHEQAVLWQGKYAIVKHENNVLRRKLRALTKQEGV